MKRSAPLRVISDRHQDVADIHINPNDGFDLGLMTTQYPIMLELGATEESLGTGSIPALSGIIYLKNEVAHNTVILNSKTVADLGLKRAQVRLLYHQGRMSIVPG